MNALADHLVLGKFFIVFKGLVFVSASVLVI